MEVERRGDRYHTEKKEGRKEGIHEGRRKKARIDKGKKWNTIGKEKKNEGKRRKTTDTLWESSPRRRKSFL